MQEHQPRHELKKRLLIRINLNEILDADKMQQLEQFKGSVR